ncbi:MAG: NUDIX hydrolase [Acidobacteriaceae bacterium]
MAPIAKKKTVTSKPVPGKVKSKTAGKAAGKNVVSKLPAKAKVQVLSSKVSYQGPVFSVVTDHVLEPGGIESHRDVIRHSGSVVILAVDDVARPRDPLIVMERQYRHAAGMYLWELPAGRKEPGEDTLPAAKRELLEETGYTSKRWTKLVRYFASPGFLGVWMQVYIARSIVAGEAQPESDENIHIELMPLSQVLKLIHAGKIHDAKTILSVLLYEAGRRSKKY